ncbi:MULTISPECIES: hypothetical protein [unclassified Methylobacterium]|uniref:hypothetical protein n=1 Tax=unclassified Methylobacterium TaxID=2615210 RepID=UPI0011C1D441|nr:MULTISPECIES: hypothetical protein [unclassified Methylobacterium]QEE39811.1 hypothetical protein FVA80_13480 [Methylobacterium sp. WL1]TXN57345.1 hypothetical protein FV241_11830 [Methylobacterium sp. WL2]
MSDRQAKPPNKPSEFWWVEWCEGMPPEPARIGFEGDSPANIEEIGGYTQPLRDRTVRLIERVLPAGRAAAAIDRLGEIAGEVWPWRIVEEISAILQVEDTQS